MPCRRTCPSQECSSKRVNTDPVRVSGVKEVDKAKAALASKKDHLKSEVIVYPGAIHGFAVRGDPGNEREKAQ